VTGTVSKNDQNVSKIYPNQQTLFCDHVTSAESYAPKFFSEIDTWRSGLPDCSWYNIPKRGKYTKLVHNIPNGSKMDQMARKFAVIFHSMTKKINQN
jgi:hypothetical protein